MGPGEDDHDDGMTRPKVTTVADAAWKAAIEPYAEHSPVLDIPAGVVACQFCGNTRFRRSRLRLGDMWEALLFRLPLRCMRCNQRQYGSYLTSSVAVGTKARGPRLAKEADTWKAWTGQEVGGGLHRPMSTVVGTRAMKLKPGRPSTLPAEGTRARGEGPAWRDEDRQIW